MTRRVALAWSGGKDSLLTLERLRGNPELAVSALVTTFAEPWGRISMHGVRETLAEAQAEALGLPLIKAWLPWPCDNETYRRRFADALVPLRETGTQAVAFGDLFLGDVRAFREAQMQALGLDPLFPLWGETTAGLARSFVDGGHRAIVVTVDAEQLSPEYLGREYDRAFLDELPAGVDPSGENGEFHTFVHAGPGFRRAVDFRTGRREIRDDRFHFLDLIPLPESQ